MGQLITGIRFYSHILSLMFSKWACWFKRKKKLADLTSLIAFRRSSHSFHAYVLTMFDSRRCVSVCEALSHFVTGFSIILPASRLCDEIGGQEKYFIFGAAIEEKENLISELGNWMGKGH